MRTILTIPARLRVLELHPGDFDDDCTRRANRRRYLADLEHAAWLLRWVIVAVVLMTSATTLACVRLLS